VLDTFQGLPAHALIVHATVVVVPTTAVSVGLAAVYPRFRAWIGWLAPVLGVISVILVQLSTMSGDKFEDRFRTLGGVTPAIKHHEHLAGFLIWFVIPLALVSIAAYWLRRQSEPSKALTGVVSALSVVLAVTVLVDVALIGHAGAEAAWKPFVQSTNHK
jgi:hypothetical protein